MLYKFKLFSLFVQLILCLSDTHLIRIFHYLFVFIIIFNFIRFLHKSGSLLIPTQST